jgi:hypothetical protein
MAFLPDNNLDYPVFIELRQSAGSGFYLNTDDTTYLVTAKHVIFDAQDNLLSTSALLTSYSNRFSLKCEVTIDLPLHTAKGTLRRHKTADVCVVEILKHQELKSAELCDGTVAVIEQGGGIVGMPLSLVHDFSQIGISNDAVIFGYPISIGSGSQLEKKKPLIRKGVIAGLNTLNETIIIDTPVYQGNSGGLAIEAMVTPHGIGWDLRGIGVVSQFVPFYEEMISAQFKQVTARFTENSGYAIVTPMDRVLEIIS